MTKQVNFRYNDADLTLLQEASEAYLYPPTSVDLLRALLRYPERLVDYRAELKSARVKSSDPARQERAAQREAAKDAAAKARADKRERQEHIANLSAAHKAAIEKRDAYEIQLGLTPYNHPAMKRDQPGAYVKWEALNARVGEFYDKIQVEKASATT